MSEHEELTTGEVVIPGDEWVHYENDGFGCGSPVWEVVPPWMHGTPVKHQGTVRRPSRVIYVIAQHETEDSVFGWCDFTPEAYTNKQIAEKRRDDLESEAKRHHEGVYYSISEVKLVGG
jgi:hypothetical protein